MNMKVLAILFMLVVGFSGCISTGTSTMTHTSSGNTITQQPTTTKLDKVWLYVNLDTLKAVIPVPMKVQEDVSQTFFQTKVEQVIIEILIEDEGRGAGISFFVLKFPYTPKNTTIYVGNRKVGNGSLVTTSTLLPIKIIYEGKTYRGNLTILRPKEFSKATYRLKSLSEIKEKTRLGTLILPEANLTIETYIERENNTYKIYVVGDGKVIGVQYISS